MLGVKTSFPLGEKNYIGAEGHAGFLSGFGENVFLGHLGVKFTHGDADGNISFGTGFGSSGAFLMNNTPATKNQVGYYINSAGGKRLTKGLMGVYELVTAPKNRLTLAAIGLRTVKRENQSLSFGLMNMFSTENTGNNKLNIVTFPYIGVCFKM